MKISKEQEKSEKFAEDEKSNKGKADINNNMGKGDLEGEKKKEKPEGEVEKVKERQGEVEKEGGEGVDKKKEKLEGDAGEKNEGNNQISNNDNNIATQKKNVDDSKDSGEQKVSPNGNTAEKKISNNNSRGDESINSGGATQKSDTKKNLNQEKKTDESVNSNPTPKNPEPKQIKKQEAVKIKEESRKTPPETPNPTLSPGSKANSTKIKEEAASSIKPSARNSGKKETPNPVVATLQRMMEKNFSPAKTDEIKPKQEHIDPTNLAAEVKKEDLEGEERPVKKESQEGVAVSEIMTQPKIIGQEKVEESQIAEKEKKEHVDEKAKEKTLPENGLEKEIIQKENPDTSKKVEETQEKQIPQPKQEPVQNVLESNKTKVSAPDPQLVGQKRNSEEAGLKQERNPLTTLKEGLPNKTKPRLGDKKRRANTQTKSKTTAPKKKRERRPKDDNYQRNYICGCGKAYLSYAALYTHAKTKHEGKFPEGTTTLQKKKQGRPKKDEWCDVKLSTEYQKTFDFNKDFLHFLDMVPGAKATKQEAHDKLIQHFPLDIFKDKTQAQRIYQKVEQMRKDLVENYGPNFLDQIDVIIYEINNAKSLNCLEIFSLFLIYVFRWVTRPFYRELVFFIVSYALMMNKKGWEKCAEASNRFSYERKNFCEEQNAEFAPDFANYFILDYFTQCFGSDSILHEPGKLSFFGLESLK